MLKLLHLDIETRPAKVYVWSTWKPHIDVDQILEPTSVLCFGAMWDHDETRTVIYKKAQKVDSLEFRDMIKTIHKLLCEADAVCHFNGIAFDMPMLNQEFARLKLGPTPPIPQIDLKRALNDNFRLVSNRLKFAGPYFGVGAKVEHEGWPLWIKCLEGNQDAWARMKAYNIGDVVLMPDLYKVLLPWLKQHPNLNLYADDDGKKRCTHCASERVEQRGWRKTSVSTYPRYYCKDCQHWSRGRVAVKREFKVQAV